MALWMGAEWAALKHCCWDTSDTTRRESSRWDYQPTFAKRRDWDKHLNLLFKGLSKKIAHGGRITFCWAKAQDEKTGNLSVHLSDSNIVSKVNLLTLIATEDLRFKQGQNQHGDSGPSITTDSHCDLGQNPHSDAVIPWGDFRSLEF